MGFVRLAHNSATEPSMYRMSRCLSTYSTSSYNVTARFPSWPLRKCSESHEAHRQGLAPCMVRFVCRPSSYDGRNDAIATRISISQQPDQAPIRTYSSSVHVRVILCAKNQSVNNWISPFLRMFPVEQL